MWSVFFFKQETAYELRISDWSSDVCSSDLVEARQEAVDTALVARVGQRRGVGGGFAVRGGGADALGNRPLHRERVGDLAERGLDRAFIARERGIALRPGHAHPRHRQSAE